MAAEGVLQMPDLQIKMGKKIAQLQKVIYHLNNKTDDHDFELQDLAGQYESEIEQILREAAEKIRVFKESLEIRKEESKVAEAVKELTARFDFERADAAALLEEQRQQATVQEDLLRGYLRTSETRVESLTRNVASLKEKVQQQGLQLQESAAAAEAAARENDNLRRTYRKEMEALKTQSQQELSEAVYSHRTQLDALAAGRAASEAALRGEIARAKTAANQGLQELISDYEQRMGKGKEEYEVEIEKLREQMREDKGKSERRAEEGAARWIEEREGLERVLEGVRDRLAGAEERCEKLGRRMEEETAQLAATSEEQEKEKRRTSSLETALSESRSVAIKLSSDLQTAVQKGDQLTAQLAGAREAAERERARAQKELAASTSECEKLQTSLREEVDNRTKTDAEYETEVGIRKALEVDLERTRRALDDITNDARQLKIDISALREESAKKDAALAMTGTEASQRIAELNSTVSNLQKEITAKVQEAEERAAAALVAQSDELTARHARALEDTMSKHRDEVNAAADAAASRELLVRQQLEGEIEQLAAGHQEELEELRERHGRESAAADERAEELQAEVRRLRDGSGELGARNETLTQQLTDTTAEKESAQKELRQTFENLAAASARADALEGELSALRRAAEGDAARLEDDMRGALAAAETRLGKTKDEYEATLQRCEEEWKRTAREQLQQAVEATAREHAFEMRELRAQMQAEQEAEKQAVLQHQMSSAAGRESELLERLAAAAAEREDLTRQHAAALQSAQEGAERAREAMEARHAEELEVVRVRAQHQVETLQAAHAEVLRSSNAEATEAAARAEALQRGEISSLKEDHAGEIARLASEWTARMNEATADAEKRQEDAKSELRAKHTAAVEELKAGHERALSELVRARETLEKEHREKENVVRRLEASNSQLQAEVASGEKNVQRINADLVTARSDFQRELRQTEAALTAAHRAEFERLMTENLAETRALQEGFEGAKAAMERGQEELQQRLDAWKARFEAREPRAEDVQRIASLEDLCAQKDDKYEKLYEATKKMRLELLNREENYNKVFGASPVIQQGVADWLKPKTNIKEPSGSGGRSARVSNVTANAAAPKSSVSSRRPSGQENR